MNKNHNVNIVFLLQLEYMNVMQGGGGGHWPWIRLVNID